MGKTQRAHMMGLRFYLFIALAVSCHGLPTTADAVVPERQTTLLQHRAAFTKMSPTAFISAMSSSGGSKEDCRTFADETTKAIKATVTSTQDVLNTIDTGSGCAALGQDLVQAEETKVAAAKTAAQNAETDVASKTTAKDDAASATFEVTFDLTSTEQPNCLDVTGKSSYTVVKTAVTAAEAAHAAAVTNAAGLEEECLCRVHKEQTDAWAAASTATASHAADWKQAHELVCALDQTTTCQYDACPTVSKPTVANGVANADSAHCNRGTTGDGSCRSGIAYPMVYQGANFYTSKTKKTNCDETCRSYDLAFDAIGSRHTGTAVGDYFCGGAGVVSPPVAGWGTVESSCDDRTPVNRYASDGTPVEPTGRSMAVYLGSNAAAYNVGVCWIHCACK